MLCFLSLSNLTEWVLRLIYYLVVNFVIYLLCVNMGNCVMLIFHLGRKKQVDINQQWGHPWTFLSISKSILKIMHLPVIFLPHRPTVTLNFRTFCLKFFSVLTLVITYWSEVVNGSYAFDWFKKWESLLLHAI